MAFIFHWQSNVVGQAGTGVGALEASLGNRAVCSADKASADTMQGSNAVHGALVCGTTNEIAL